MVVVQSGPGVRCLLSYVGFPLYPFLEGTWLESRSFLYCCMILGESLPLLNLSQYLYSGFTTAYFVDGLRPE